MNEVIRFLPTFLSRIGAASLGAYCLTQSFTGSGVNTGHKIVGGSIIALVIINKYFIYDVKISNLKTIFYIKCAVAYVGIMDI